MRRAKVWAVVVASMGFAGAGAQACDYHWALGVDEPTGIWPEQTAANTKTLSSASSVSAADALAALSAQDAANTAAINKWMQNPTHIKATIKNNANVMNTSVSDANVQSVAYNDSNVYIKATGLASYTMGPFPGNPATPTDRNRTVRLPLNPTANPGTKTTVGLGPVGVMVNGVAFFDPRDNQSYNNANVWHQNANVFEASSFDTGPAHPAPDMGNTSTGNYHYHQSPTALLTQLDPGNTGQHASPLIGFAFDGFPVYGPYGTQNADGTGAITRMKSGYSLKNMTTRTNGPNTTTVALGSYIEDFEYTGNPAADASVMDLYNGRFEINADYPSGTYAYHLTLNAAGTSVYPYIIGPSYYGIVDTGNFGAGNITVPGDVTFFVAPEPGGLALLGLGALLTLRPGGRNNRGNIAGA